MIRIEDTVLTRLAKAENLVAMAIESLMRCDDTNLSFASGPLASLIDNIEEAMRELRGLKDDIKEI